MCLGIHVDSELTRSCELQVAGTEVMFAWDK